MKCFRLSPARARRNPHLLQVGARFTVIGSTGDPRPAWRMAARTRSWLTRTVESGKPAVLKIGKAPRGLPTDGASAPRLLQCGHAERFEAPGSRAFGNPSPPLIVRNPSRRGGMARGRVGGWIGQRRTARS